MARMASEEATKRTLLIEVAAGEIECGNCPHLGRDDIDDQYVCAIFGTLETLSHRGEFYAVDDGAKRSAACLEAERLAAL